MDALSPVNLSHGLKSNNRKSPPIICFSHLRWDFVLQRPQHLMSRMANDRAVFFFEEHIETEHTQAYLEFHPCKYSNVVAVRPRIPASLDEAQREQALSQLLDQLLLIHRAGRPVLWFYTPMMFRFARHVDAAAVVYDCMDELSQLPLRARWHSPARGGVAAPRRCRLHRRLQHLRGQAAPARQHPPLSLERGRQHFAKARDGHDRSARTMARSPRPRVRLLRRHRRADRPGTAARSRRRRPDWQIVMVGPVVKIDEAELPRAPEHPLSRQEGLRTSCRPILRGWDVALMPFAINEATRFISPTKTPEYLAGGRPVVSTPGARRGAALRRGRRRLDRGRRRAISSPPASRLWRCRAIRQLPAAGGRDAVHAVLGQDLRSMNGADRRGDATAQCTASAADRCRQALGIGAATVPALRLHHRGAGFAGSVMAERLASVGQEGPRVRQASACRRQRLRLLRRGRHADPPIRAAHLPHQQRGDLRLSLPLHRVAALRAPRAGEVGGKLLPMPINRTTLNGLYGLDLQTDEEAAAFLAARAEPVDEIRTSRDVVVSQVGTRSLRDLLQGYTRKQWGLDPSELDKSVTARVPTRTNTDDRYFLDNFQAMPLHGYTRMFENMLDHRNIDLALGRRLSTTLARNVLGAKHDLHRARSTSYFDHRYRRAALPQPRVPARDARPAAVPAGGGRELSRRGRALYPHHRVQAPHRPGAPEDQHHLRVFREPRATRTTRSRGRRTRRCIKQVRGAGACQRTT